MTVRPKFEALGLLEYEHAPDDFECDWAEMKKPLEKFGQIPEAIKYGENYVKTCSSRYLWKIRKSCN
jgi:hypothetical protein